MSPQGKTTPKPVSRTVTLRIRTDRGGEQIAQVLIDGRLWGSAKMKATYRTVVQEAVETIIDDICAEGFVD